MTIFKRIWNNCFPAWSPWKLVEDNIEMLVNNKVCICNLYNRMDNNAVRLPQFKTVVVRLKNNIKKDENTHS